MWFVVVVVVCMCVDVCVCVCVDVCAQCVYDVGVLHCVCACVRAWGQQIAKIMGNEDNKSTEIKDDTIARENFVEENFMQENFQKENFAILFENKHYAVLISRFVL